MKPLPTAIFMNPADFDKLRKAAISDDTKDLPAWVLPFTALRIPVHVDPFIPAGQPRFWPPESAPSVIRCTVHDDCVANAELGRACYLSAVSRCHDSRRRSPAIPRRKRRRMHSEQLRTEFEQPDIVDGWTILAEGDGSGNYGYGSRDLLMYLLGPDGKLYCQEASCCSCNGIEGSFEPVETNLETIERDLVGYSGKGNTAGTWEDGGKAKVCEEALEKIRGFGRCRDHDDCRENEELARACWKASPRQSDPHEKGNGT